MGRSWGLLDRTWADLGAQEGPKGGPKGTQEAPKTRPKLHQNFDRFLDRFWTDFGGPGNWSPARVRNARGLAELFDFEEFEDHFEARFSHAPALRVAADLIALRAVRRAGLGSPHRSSMVG